MFVLLINLGIQTTHTEEIQVITLLLISNALLAEGLIMKKRLIKMHSVRIARDMATQQITIDWETPLGGIPIHVGILVNRQTPAITAPPNYSINPNLLIHYPHLLH